MSQNVAGALRDLISLGEHFGYFDRDTSRNNGLNDVLDEMRLSCGIGDEVLVNDMETVGDWTEHTSGKLDIANEASTVKVGTNCQKFTATAAYDSTDQVYDVSTDYINAGNQADINPFTGRKQQNWNNSDYLICWGTTTNDADFSTAGDLKLNIQNYAAGSASWGTAVNVPAVTYVATNYIWRGLAMEITAFTRNHVEKIRFENYNTTAAEYIMIDEIIRCKFTDGKGPLRAACIPLPIKNAEAILQGNIVRYDVTTRRAINWVTAAAGGDLGPCVIPGTGNAAGTVMCWVAANGIVRLRTAASSGCAADDGIAGGSVNTIIDTANMAAEVTSIGKALETPAEDSTGGHDIDCRVFGVSEGFAS